MHPNLWSSWFKPDDGDIIAYITIQRIAEIGGANLATVNKVAMNGWYTDQGVMALTRWMRLNCKTIGTPVNVWGRTGFAFKNNDDAVLFKLTWG